MNDICRKVELTVFATNQRRDAYNSFGLIRGEVEPGKEIIMVLLKTKVHNVTSNTCNVIKPCYK